MKLNTVIRLFILCSLVSCSGLHLFAQSAHNDQFLALAPGDLQMFPTFNSCSYYYHPTAAEEFHVEYKRSNDAKWRSAHATVCDQPVKIHKGSLFYLDEDVEYQIRILAGEEHKVIKQASFRTWNSNPPVGKTIDINDLPDIAENGIVITEQGTPNAWIKYTASSTGLVKRNTRDADKQDATIVLKGAKYVILENLSIEGGKRYGILVEDSDYVRILNCDISGWGRTGVQQFDNNGQSGQYKDAEGRWINYDGGIQIRRSFATVVERCYIHDPRGRANAWTFSHPTGPQAIVVDTTRGSSVIRWNDFIGSDEHRWNDVIEGLSNHDPDGGFYRDSDVIGNYLAFGNDDGIELEGGGMNLRFMGNKIEGTLCSISTGANMIGPQYIIGNLIVNPGDEEGLAFNYLKNTHGVEQKGKRFVYNNSFTGYDRTCNTYGDYGRATVVDAGLGTMQNNIFICKGFGQGNWLKAEHFDNDLFWMGNSVKSSKRIVDTYRRYGQEKNAFAVDPQFVNPAAGDYRLSASSQARGYAAEIKGITQSGDDLGAFFCGTSALPLRPFPLIVTPTQINFPAQGGSSTITLSLPKNVTKPFAFQVRKNNVFSWFTVSPSNGIVKPGETVKLTVNAASDKLALRPLFRGAFLVRAEDGLSYPISVYAKGNYIAEKRPKSASPNTVYIPADSNAADTSVDIPQSGTYSLLLRTSLDVSRRSRDRFDISVNGKSSNATFEPSYQWSYQPHIASGQERVVWLCSLGKLEKGKKEIEVNTASKGLSISEYIITDKPAVFFNQEINRLVP